MKSGAVSVPDEGRIVGDPRTARENEMVRRILLGALSAASRQGARGLSVRDIAAAAGVSRATVYRYFDSRQAVLAGMSDLPRRCWERQLQEVLYSSPDADDRVRLVLRSLFRTLEVLPAAKRHLERDPGYVLSYLEKHMDDLADTIAVALAPALDEAQAVRSGELGRQEAAEIVLRMFLGETLIPSGCGYGLDQQVIGFWSLVGGRTPDLFVDRVTPGPALRLVRTEPA